jgi:MFS family permease
VASMQQSMENQNSLKGGGPGRDVQGTTEPIENQPQSRGRYIATVVLLAMAIASYGAMETMIVPILPIVQAKLGATGPQITWMLTGMLLVAAVSLPLMSRLAEIYDKRKVLNAALIIAAVGAVMSALAPNVTILIIGQLLQGFGLASTPVAIGVLRDTVPRNRLHVANGIVIACASFAAAAGLLAVGPIIQYLNYTFVYWIPVSIIVVVILLSFLVIPPLAPQTRGRADWLGAVILGGGLALVLTGVTLSSEHGWLSWQVLGCIATGIIALGAFVVWERRVESPLVDLQAMGRRDVLLILGTNVCGGFGQFTLFVILPSLSVLPLASGYGMGGDSYTASLVIFTFVVMAAVSAAAVPSLSRLVGWRAVMMATGVVLALAGLLLLLIGSVSWIPFLAAGLAGFAIGGGQLQQVNLVVDRVPAERAPSMAGSLWVLRSVAGTFGAQVTAAILAAQLIPGASVSSWAGYSVAIGFIAAAGVGTVVLTALIPRGDTPSAR